jgi:aminoglycoside phosphotransferase (APT) family kinase protein
MVRMPPDGGDDRAAICGAVLERRGAQEDTPDWVRAVFAPERIQHASRVPWGFRNEVWSIGLDDGRHLAATRFVDRDASASIVSLTERLQPRLRAVGVPTAALVDVGPASTGLLITEFVDGMVGAALLAHPDGAALVGSLLGATWRRLAGLDVDGLSLDPSWSRPGDLARSSRARLSRAGPWLGGMERRRLGEAIAACADLLVQRRPGFVHGDLAPVNVIVGDRRLAALLDFEFARLAEPLLDAGWFDAMVAYHHPAERPAAWQAFLTASGIDADESVTRDLLRILPMLRFLEILDDRRAANVDAGHWVAMLKAQLARA